MAKTTSFQSGERTLILHGFSITHSPLSPPPATVDVDNAASVSAAALPLLCSVTLAQEALLQGLGRNGAQLCGIRAITEHFCSWLGMSQLLYDSDTNQILCRKDSACIADSTALRKRSAWQGCKNYGA